MPCGHHCFLLLHLHRMSFDKLKNQNNQFQVHYVIFSTSSSTWNYTNIPGVQNPHQGGSEKHRLKVANQLVETCNQPRALDNRRE
ncbi:hypothetical protein KSS87_007285 [Heliosperma pusillum]|nr:hypothetical protein KSS87_007285 [Heliosperma pusillum]